MSDIGYIKKPEGVKPTNSNYNSFEVNRDKPVVSNMSQFKNNKIQAGQEQVVLVDGNNRSSLSLSQFTPDSRVLLQSIVRAEIPQNQIPVLNKENRTYSTMLIYSRNPTLQGADISKPPNNLSNPVEVVRLSLQRREDGFYEINKVARRKLNSGLNTEEIKRNRIQETDSRSYTVNLKQNLKVNDNGSVNLKVKAETNEKNSSETPTENIKSSEKELNPLKNISNQTIAKSEQISRNINLNRMLNLSENNKNIAKNIIDANIEVISEKTAQIITNRILNSINIKNLFTSIREGTNTNALKIFTNLLKESIKAIPENANINISLNRENRMQQTIQQGLILAQQMIAKLERGNKFVDLFLQAINSKLEAYNVKLVLNGNNFNLVPYLPVNKEGLQQTIPKTELTSNKVEAKNANLAASIEEAFRRRRERRIRNKQLKTNIKSMLKQIGVNVNSGELDKDIAALPEPQQAALNNATSGLLNKLNQGGGPEIQVQIMSQLRLYLHTCLSPKGSAK